MNSTRSKGPRRNSFKLFVPSTPPNYPEEGSEINVTVSNDHEKHSKTDTVLPCISKKMNGEVSLFRIYNEVIFIEVKFNPLMRVFMCYKFNYISRRIENLLHTKIPDTTHS